MKPTPQWTKAIILRSTDYGESDRIFGLLTREFGKVSVFARGARNSKKRFSGVDLFVTFRAILTPPKNSASQFYVLNSIENLNLQIDIRRDIQKFCQLSYMAECTWMFLGDHDPHGAYFDWLELKMETLRSQPLKVSDQVRLDLEMLKWFGYFPSFTKCYECGKHIQEENVFFEFSKGGILCRHCQRPSSGRWLYSKSFHENALADLREPINAFVQYTLGRTPKSQIIREELIHVG
ncbi:MAG: DNA repair protein RecO [Bdellovibrionales bacterium]|nr:DNA repair protein RecO [Bdellovibrionales bacterium]